MDLKVKDVADLLNVSENTIYQWLEQGKIPGYRLNQEYCFSRGEIQNWMISHSGLPINGSQELPKVDLHLDDESVAALRGGNQQFSLYRALHKGQVLLSIPGQTKEEIIRVVVKEIASNLEADEETLFALLWDRERLQPTALNNGIGIPHTRDFLLKTHDTVFVGFPEHPIDYGALDGRPVHTLFFLLACEDKRHLHLLAKIALFCSQQEALDFLKQRPSKEALLEYVKSWESCVNSQRH